LAEPRGKCGPGAVHRLVRETQRQFFDPPILSSVSKYE